MIGPFHHRRDRKPPRAHGVGFRFQFNLLCHSQASGNDNEKITKRRFGRLYGSQSLAKPNFWRCHAKRMAKIVNKTRKTGRDPRPKAERKSTAGREPAPMGRGRTLGAIKGVRNWFWEPTPSAKGRGCRQGDGCAVSGRWARKCASRRQQGRREAPSVNNASQPAHGLWRQWAPRRSGPRRPQ